MHQNSDIVRQAGEKVRYTPIDDKNPIDGH